ncbi:hypothetical protein NVP1031O_101 [Vibrio phage 1.031.O._10N.261.46.F8]|nr:hypothetical protein NVP1031O_101 [Vibrio phage 1.031.O._10N.261.46.F8]
MLYSDVNDSNELIICNEGIQLSTPAPKLKYDASMDDYDNYSIGVPCSLDEFNDLSDLH